MLAAREIRYLAPQLIRSPAQARHLSRWFRARGGSPLDYRLPWLPFDVVDYLETLLTADAVVFEYGGGGSTLWFSDRAAAVVTVEHDSEWAEKLAAATESDPRITILHRDPSGSYEDYISAINTFPDGSFDIVAVDGRERVRCVSAAMPKVRPGGHLLLDDSDRERYASAHETLAAWPAVTFRGLTPFKPIAGTTTIWTKPANVDGGSLPQ